MSKLKMIFVVLVALCATSFLSGQETGTDESKAAKKTQLEQALEVSRVTGKPIFAVAGRST